LPWFPDFVGAVELARHEARAAGQADPVAQYLRALDAGDSDVLESTWPSEVVVLDPRVGEVRGHRQLRRFLERNRALMAEIHARTEVVATFGSGSRAVMELLARVTPDGEDGRELRWPVAVVAESPDDRSVVFRTYCRQWPVEERHVRPPILDPGPHRPGEVIGLYLDALEAGDTDRILKTFARDGSFRESFGPHAYHQGTVELTSFFSKCFETGGVELECCEATDDGARCALECNCVRWDARGPLPQASLAVFERGPDGLLAAVRVYDDLEAAAVVGDASPR
jgi:ketosteroid isomerase-like protein